MKLELKHVAPYLPYRLKVKYDDSEDIFEIDPFAHETDYNEMKFPLFHCIEGMGTARPLLRPLSQLNTQEGYMPFEDEIRLLYPNWDAWFGYMFDGEKLCLSILGGNAEDVKPLDFYYDVVQLLYKYHFDLYNLIENNLAIDVNSLKVKTN